MRSNCSAEIVAPTMMEYTLAMRQHNQNAELSRKELFPVLRMLLWIF